MEMFLQAVLVAGQQQAHQPLAHSNELPTCLSSRRHLLLVAQQSQRLSLRQLHQQQVSAVTE